MALQNRWLSDAEIEKSKALTRKNAQRTWRHHYVPQMYLRRWAEDGRVRCTEIATDHSEVESVEDVAYERDFYQMSASDIDADEHPDLWFETHMSRIENAAARWLTALDSSEDGRITNINLRENLAVFIGLQSQRVPRRRQAELDLDAAIARFGARNIIDDRRLLPLICRANGVAYDPGRHQQIVEQILAQTPVSVETKPKAIDTAIAVWRNTIAEHLAERTWWLASTSSALATCDDPVVLIGRAGQPRQFQLRFQSTPLILFPIAPDRLLVLAGAGLTLERPFALDHEETAAINREIVANCSRFVYERPETELARIPVPDLPEFDPTTASTFWEAVLQIPSRWFNASPTPEWPLRRWTT